ncbi:TonB-dependent receptor [Pedobacter puniceum]|uniref:TonB-dependent receptor n=1 Tax=Pedobacter puniceum TaxID=2666136 RepID=A0A7K0FJF7_9SPHI|nr:TonB-dependent receptor [Pedobacter puniceum]MRX46063.1 TonB-dependent receptor [Pedobacter puniceum]
MKLRISLLLSFVCFTSIVFAQKASINGKVVDGNDHPVAGATIVLKGTVRAAQTNVKGEYVIKGLEKGNYTLILSFVGMKNKTTEVSLSDNQNSTVNFKLEDDGLLLNEIEVSTRRGIKGNETLPDVTDFRINAAKKNELIKLDNINANLAMNNSRQIFGRTPGISVWENDGSGIQLGVASRGLSPNRSWEFNVRMDGYDITPDPMGYPEAYYTPPMEVVDRIEIIRGASSLQYGPQFGGLMNFVLRKPDISTRLTFESQNTVGSNGLFSTFNYIGGTVGRLSYTAYYQKRRGDGWRDNGFFDTDHAHFELSYAVSKKFKIGTEITYMTTESQQPGGLTDVQFNQDARQSNRSRNWFSTPWLVPSLNAEYIFNEKTKLSWKAFGTIAERNSVGIVSAITTPDNLGNRQVDRDYYTTYGSELRLLTEYRALGLNNTLAAGVRYFNGHIDRKQQGVGTNGTDMDFNLSSGVYPRNLDFANVNSAAFLENIFHITDKFLVTGGVRLENISSTMEGQFNATSNLTPATRKRNFLLVGAGAEYKITPTTKFYSNISQAYRPVLISDLTPPATTDVIDPNLKDARGYNFDFGYRGQVSNFLNFDIDYFYLNYDDRIGTITQSNGNSQNFQFRTNLGRSVSKGFEAYVEVDPVTAIFKRSRVGYVSLFASLAHIDATYQDFKTTSVNSSNQIVEGNLAGKRVENAPRSINRFGATYSLKGFSMTWQLSKIGEAFADASNTVAPNAAATTGLIPAYSVQDLSASYKFLKHYNIKAGVNNLTDERYFTRRAGGYPGPGIMPADGRIAYLSLGVKF